MDIKQIRQRIMCEAYDLADRGDHEGYNAVKVMCSEVLELINAVVAAEREACAKLCDEKVDAEYKTGKVDHHEMAWTQACAIAIRARGEK